MSTTRFGRRNWLGACGLALAAIGGWLAFSPGQAAQAAAAKQPTAEAKTAALEQDVTQGSLRVVKEDGTVVECPLRHTDVRADVSGFIARVKVVQTFYNPTDERIEAVYVFPLPHEAAVDDMTMVIGSRKIVGVIKRRAEARQIYEEALAAGQTAALLEQERPNIFTQSVGNIDPGQEVNIEISYVDVLNYDMGTYEFHFPMVVGPRFIPGAPVNAPKPNPPELQGKVSPPVPDTTRVPDASRITPPVLKPGYRNGHDISLAVRLDAGVPIQDLKVANHEAKVVREGQRQADVTLSPADSMPNKDFVLRYHVVGKKPELAMLAHTGDHTDTKRLGHGYFLLMIQPQEDERLTKSPPREIVFLLDVSGSMNGEPTEKVKESMREMLKLCREIDTLQVITFANHTQQLFDKPVPVTRENVAKALNFTQGIQGGGGTQMLEGVKRAIDQPLDKQRVRIVIMLTDGYIGNEAEIIEHVGKSCGDQIRFWAVGIGSSPNMFLIDGVARQGGGMGKRLGLQENAAGLAEEVITRIQRAQLAKIKLDWGGLNVAETYPAKLPELWAGRPVILFGRYTGGGQAAIKVNGVVEGTPVSWPLQVALPDQQPAHDVLAKVWARKKIEDLMQQTFYQGSPAVEEEVTAIALDYRLMSQYTSFVAVDAKDAADIGKQRLAQPPRRMLVPVPLPAGTRWEGFFGPLGEGRDEMLELAQEKPMPMRADALAKSPGYSRMQGGKAADAAKYRMAHSGLASPTAPMATRGAAPVAGEARKKQAAQSLAIQRRLRASPGPAAPSGGGMGGFGFAMPAAKPMPAMGPTTREAAPHADMDEFQAAGDQYMVQALAADTEKAVTAARSLLDAGRKHVEQKQYEEARTGLVRAYFLATAALNRGNHGAQPISSESLAALESLHADRVKQWQQDLPALGVKLDLVLRDMAVNEALEALSRAAQLKIQLRPGSVEDAGSILPGRGTRVTYLDLRGATAAQALDWLLQPLRLTWLPEASRGAAAIVVSSDRRLPRVSAWVYDASLLALPSPKELGGERDWNKAVAKVKQDAEQFMTALRKALQASAEEVTWFAPGQVLVIGDAPRHEQSSQILAQLADPKAKPAAALAALHAKTSQRAAERKEQLEKLSQSHRLQEVAGVHDEFAWKLLAAACGGDMDAEAFTELQIAWKAAETKQLLDGQGAGLALRSAWAVTTASRALPNQTELAALAAAVRAQIRPAADKAVAALKAHPQDVSAVVTAVYAALAVDEVDLRAKVVAALPPEATVGSPMVGALLAAQRLLSEAVITLDSGRLAELATTGSFASEDVTVLLALACRRAGGDAWAAFRAQMGELLGQQPLPGSVVVLVNRLSGTVPGLGRS